MKARNFRYIKPESLQHAYRILHEADGAAIPIAGGQSLLATLNMRLSAPELLVDIGDLAELSHESSGPDGVALGALTRHRELLASQMIREHLPLLTRAASHVGHVSIRNRGTLAGSIAFADPAAELPACCVALRATLVLGSLAGEREVTAENFFKGMFETDLRPGELIVAVRFPASEPGTVIGFDELSRRHGDFAIVGLAATAIVEDRRIKSARLVYLGCVDRAKVAPNASSALRDMEFPLTDMRAVAAAIGDDLAPDDMPGLRGSTRLHLARVLTRRVLASLSSGVAA